MRCVVFAILVLSQVSCAYHFGALKRSLPGGYNKVSVPVFKNSTQEPGIESYFTTAMIEEIERNRFASVTLDEEAQVVLEGTVTAIVYERGALFSPQDDLGVALPEGASLAKEYYVKASTVLRLVRKSDQKILWTSGYNSEKQYPAPQITIKGLNSANALYNHSARLQTAQALAKEMMTQAHNHMTENF